MQRLKQKSLKQLFLISLVKVGMPMLIVDSELSVKTKSKFSARTAGIVGFSIFGKDHTFALNDKLELNVGVLKHFFKNISINLY